MVSFIDICDVIKIPFKPYLICCSLYYFSVFGGTSEKGLSFSNGLKFS